MHKVLLLAILSAGVLLARGEEQTLTLDDLTQSAERWAKENLDEDVLKALQSADRKRVKDFLAELEKEFRGKYVIDLARLKGAAQSIIPLLEQYEETEPYAIWLKAQMDFLEVAEELRRTIPAPKPEPGQPPKPVLNPPPQVAREIWIKKVSERPWPEKAKPYVPKLKSIFAAQNTPAELVWVAEVESSFDPRARSPAGAAGLFQLMPATAHRYGLKTWPLDQRTRPEPSARAAAQYLGYLHRHFKDWRLALAAYNAGEGTVEKAMSREKSHGYDAIAVHLPAETQMYVPRVEATILRREGIKLAELRAAQN